MSKEFKSAWGNIFIGIIGTLIGFMLVQSNADKRDTVLVLPENYCIYKAPSVVNDTDRLTCLNMDIRVENSSEPDVFFLYVADGPNKNTHWTMVIALSEDTVLREEGDEATIYHVSLDDRTLEMLNDMLASLSARGFDCYYTIFWI